MPTSTELPNQGGLNAEANRVLIIGAQGVLGTLLARGFREAGWHVVRGGRRPERAGDFRLVDLDQPETVSQALSEVGLAVSTVRDDKLAADDGKASDRPGRIFGAKLMGSPWRFRIVSLNVMK